MHSQPNLVPIERLTLWDRAYNSLRSALMAGSLQPGQRIVLREMADQLGISLTPVRDAVNRLVAEGALERGSVGVGGGATVPLLNADQFAQLMLVRGSLEPVATAAAIGNTTPERLDAIEADLAEMKAALSDGRIGGYFEAHYRFHFGIYKLCRMPILLEIIETAWLRCAPTLTLPQYTPGLKRYPLHVAALQALRNGDGDAAAEAIRADIQSATAEICPLLDQANPVGKPG
jgi:DNA-binding GntR family transcriptional regulator